MLQRIKSYRNIINTIFFISVIVTISYPIVNTLVIFPFFNNLTVQKTENDSIKIAKYLGNSVFSIENINEKSIKTKEIEKICKDFGIEKIKIFNKNGIVKHSTDSGDIGNKNKHDYFYDKVSKGEVFTKVVKKDNQTLEGRIVQRDVVETYIPYMEKGHFIGAFEIYYDISENLRLVHGITTKTSLLIILASSFLLIVYYLLHNITKRALTQRDQSEKALRQHRDNLDELVRQRTQELEEARDEWENSFNSISDIITLQDKNMRIFKANAAAFDFFKLSPEELLGKYCYELFRGSMQPCSGCPGIKTLQDSCNHSGIIRHKSLGKTFHVAFSPVHSEEGDFRYTVHIAKDITDQKKMEEELFQAHKMEAIGTLAGGIAHDFNNILAAIIGYQQLVKLKIEGGQDVTDELDAIYKAGYRAKHLVKQILTFSRKGTEPLEPLQPSPTIKEALKLMRASLPTTIEIREEICSDCGAIIANPTSVHQIIVNLFTNALHSMEDEKGILTVKLSPVILEKNDGFLEGHLPEGPYIELMVRDTGCGIDQATLERIFEPYYTTKDVGKGSGMGLALVHGIVQDCGGFVRVESEQGKGSTFHVYFPAIEEPIEESRNKEEEALPTGHERILVVDDEEIIVKMYQETLERLGYDVTTHYSGVKALEVFQNSPDGFDVILTDQTMPHVSGSELAKEALQIRPDIPIILCTGFSSIISEDQAKEIGIAKFVLKPFNTRDLAHSVREVLDRKA